MLTCLHAYMITCLHAYLLACMNVGVTHAYMLASLHAYTLTCMWVHDCTLICSNVLRHAYVPSCIPASMLICLPTCMITYSHAHERWQDSWLHASIVHRVETNMLLCGELSPLAYRQQAQLRSKDTIPNYHKTLLVASALPWLLAADQP